MCFPQHPPSVVWMSPLNSLRVSLIMKLDFPAPASPAKTRRYIGVGSSASSMLDSNGWGKEQKWHKLHRFMWKVLKFMFIIVLKTVRINLAELNVILNLTDTVLDFLHQKLWLFWSQVTWWQLQTHFVSSSSQTSLDSGDWAAPPSHEQHLTVGWTPRPTTLSFSSSF